MLWSYGKWPEKQSQFLILWKTKNHVMEGWYTNQIGMMTVFEHPLGVWPVWLIFTQLPQMFFEMGIKHIKTYQNIPKHIKTLFFFFSKDLFDTSYTFGRQDLRSWPPGPIFWDDQHQGLREPMVETHLIPDLGSLLHGLYWEVSRGIILYYVILYYIKSYYIIIYFITLYYILLYYSLLYYIILLYIILYYIIVCYIILYYIILYYITLYYTILYYIIFYYIILYYIIYYYILLYYIVVHYITVY